MTSWLDGAGLDWPSAAATAWLLAAALAGGLARGFSGFGTAMIFIPVAALAVGPRAAPPLLLLLEIGAILALAPGAWKLADRRAIGWLSLGAAIGTPVGVAALARIDPLVLRWGIAGAILALLLLLLSGWRLRGPQPLGRIIGIGVVSGAMGGIAMISGPPVMTYLLGRGAPAPQVRADFSLYIAAGGALAGLSFAVAGLLTPALLPPALLAGPVYGIGIWVGSRMFGLASEQTFRQACYAMIVAAVILGLPVWDGLLR